MRRRRLITKGTLLPQFCTNLFHFKVHGKVTNSLVVIYKVICNLLIWISADSFHVFFHLPSTPVTVFSSVWNRLTHFLESTFTKSTITYLWRTSVSQFWGIACFVKTCFDMGSQNHKAACSPNNLLRFVSCFAKPTRNTFAPVHINVFAFCCIFVTMRAGTPTFFR